MKSILRSGLIVCCVIAAPCLAQTKADDDYLTVQLQAIKSIAFARDCDLFNFSCDAIEDVASLLSLVDDERLDVPLLELAEYFFGRESLSNTEAASNRGYRMVPKIQARLKTGGEPCTQHSPQERKLLSRGFFGYVCGDADLLRDTHFDLLNRIARHRGKPAPKSWPHVLLRADEPLADREHARASAYRATLKTLPVIQATSVRRKGQEGWPTWFRTGVFVEVLAREPHAAMDAALLELADFSLGAEADAVTQRALLYRMRQSPQFVARVQQRLEQAPSWFDFPASGKVPAAWPLGEPPVNLETLRPYGVKALSKAERNLQLQKLLAAHAARQ